MDIGWISVGNFASEERYRSDIGPAVRISVGYRSDIGNRPISVGFFFEIGPLGHFQRGSRPISVARNFVGWASRKSAKNYEKINFVESHKNGLKENWLHILGVLVKFACILRNCIADQQRLRYLTDFLKKNSWKYNFFKKNRRKCDVALVLAMLWPSTKM